MLFPYLSRQAQWSHLQKQKLSRKSRAQRSLILTQQKGATSGWLKRARFGPAGFCLVRFEDEEPFPSEVPNLWLAPQAAESGPKLKRVRAAL